MFTNHLYKYKTHSKLSYCRNPCVRETGDAPAMILSLQFARCFYRPIQHIVSILYPFSTKMTVIRYYMYTAFLTLEMVDYTRIILCPF